MDWKWHKDHCIARDVDSAPIERSRRDVNLLRETNKMSNSMYSEYKYDGERFIYEAKDLFVKKKYGRWW